MADRRGVLVPFLILAYILLHEPNTITPERRRPLIDDVIEQEQRSLSVLQNSTWDSYFGSQGHTLNLTGLDPEDGYAWESLRVVKSRAREQLEYALGEWGSNALDGVAEGANPIPLYSNATGHLRGSWSRSKLQESVPIPQLNLSAFAPLDPFGQPGHIRHFQRNVTGSEGDIRINFGEKNFVDLGNGVSNITELGVDLALTDTYSYDEWELHMRGVYFVDLGQAILTTTSDKFAGIFTLPHLALSEHTFERARQVLNDSISHTIQRQIDHGTESLNPWHAKVDISQDPGSRIPSCDLIMYLQQLAPVTDVEYSANLLSFVEDELRHPTGAVLPKPPEMRFSMLAFSPDCGYVLESKGPPDEIVQNGNHLTGPRAQVHMYEARHHLLLYTLSLALQLFLLMRQMREASTPSTRSRISFYTVATLALGDGFTTMVFLLISVYWHDIWINLVATGFLVFMSVAFFGMRFLHDIWQVQAPERERRVREEIEEERRREQLFQSTLQRIREERGQRNAASTNPANPDAAATTTEPLGTPQPPTTGQQTNPGGLLLSTPTIPRPPVAPIDTGATPVFMPSDQEGLESIGPDPSEQTDINTLVRLRMPSFLALYGRFYLLLLGTLFVSINAILWPQPVQRVYFATLGLLYMSFWVPQILRNVQRNCRHALNWEFVFGQSILRMVPFAYIYAYEHNVVFSKMDYKVLFILGTWVWIQLAVLVSQEIVGPRWFIRKDWAPPAYDYHPVLRADEEGATMPIGFSQAAAAAGDTSTPTSPILDRTPTSPSLARRASVPKKKYNDKGSRIVDCAICMQDFIVPVIEAGASNEASLGGSLLMRRTYMVTPCRHIFHSACLEGWMKYRLQCPICRETLPPL